VAQLQVKKRSDVISGLRARTAGRLWAVRAVRKAIAV
jgi:hypothetical protein